MRRNSAINQWQFNHSRAQEQNPTKASKKQSTTRFQKNKLDQIYLDIQILKQKLKDQQTDNISVSYPKYKAWKFPQPHSFKPEPQNSINQQDRRQQRVKISYPGHRKPATQDQYRTSASIQQNSNVNHLKSLQNNPLEPQAVEEHQRSRKNLKSKFNSGAADQRSNQRCRPFQQSGRQMKDEKVKTTAQAFQHPKQIERLRLQKRSPAISSNYFHENQNPNEDDLVSVDTYEMEIGDDYKMPNIIAEGDMRNTVKPSNYRMRSIEAEQSNEAQNNFPVKDSVLGNKSERKDSDYLGREILNQKIKIRKESMRFCQSAGGKGMGYIVNLIKPKVQLYDQQKNEEDKRASSTIQDQSGKAQEQQQGIDQLRERLNEVPKRKQILEKMQKQHISRAHSSSDYNNNKLFSSEVDLEKEIKGLSTVEQFRQQMRIMITKRNQRMKNSTNSLKNSLMKYPNQNIGKRAEENAYRGFKIQENPIISSTVKDLIKEEKEENYKKRRYELDQKVKKAVEKTKKAIQVLNKAKSRVQILGRSSITPSTQETQS